MVDSALILKLAPFFVYAKQVIRLFATKGRVALTQR